MDIVKEIEKILEQNKCACFYLDKDNLLLKHNLTKEESRQNLCNHRVFTQITGLLVMNHVHFAITDNNDIKIFL